MENNRTCRACTITKVTNDEIKKAIDRLAGLKGMRFVDDEAYQKRLELCSECCYLEASTTCLQCGCIVQIKAKLPDSTCPYPKNRKW